MIMNQDKLIDIIKTMEAYRMVRNNYFMLCKQTLIPIQSNSKPIQYADFHFLVVLKDAGNE